MKSPVFMLSTLVALVLSAGSTFAQSSPSTFTVPFDFVAGPTALPAGEYHISNGPALGTLSFRGGDRHTVQVSAGNIETLDASVHTKLVFHRYGGRYFLSQLWIEGENLGREVPIGSQEREMARKSDPKSMVVIASTGVDKGEK
jgi:hypothetical protein